MLIILALLPWIALVYIASERSAHLTRELAGVALLVTINVFLLARVLLAKETKAVHPMLVLFGFALTFSALAGAYASADLAAAHTAPRCYLDATHSHGHWSMGHVDAIYYAFSTLTTAGFGDVTAHEHTCRTLTAVELGVGFPVLGLSIAGVAAVVFREIQKDK